MIEDAHGREVAGPDPSVEADPGVRARLIRPHRLSFLLRGVALWFALHLALAFLGLVFLGAVEAVGLMAVVYGAVAIDQRVRREELLLANAGVPPWVGPAHALSAAAVLEGTVQILVAVAGP